MWTGILMSDNLENIILLKDNLKKLKIFDIIK